MAQITDPEAIRFVNEVVRPLCEERRAHDVRVNALQTVWFGGLNAFFSAGTDTVEDGREAEGVSRLTAQQVTDAVGQLIKIAAGQSAADNTEIIQKPCVRQLP